MGTWGASLYANDTTADIRGDYKDKLRRGKANEEATKELINENSDVFGNAEEEPLFWFALADTQWDYGRLTPEVKEKAMFFLSQDDGSSLWKAGLKYSDVWKETLAKLKEKLESPQPPIKKVSKYRLYSCKWKLGDVFAYRFNSDYSKQKGFDGKYVIFRKVSEDTRWPGHIIPVVQVYKWIGVHIPPLEDLPQLDLMPSLFGSTESDKLAGERSDCEYRIKLISESEKAIPKDNLFLLGNIPGDDLTPFRGHDYWTGYCPVGWESSKYNTKFEHCIIDIYNSVIGAQ